MWCAGKKGKEASSEIIGDATKQTKTDACDNPIKSAVESEFVSDNFQTTDKDLEEVRAGMKILGIDTLATTASGPSVSGKLASFWFF